MNLSALSRADLVRELLSPLVCASGANPLHVSEACLLYTSPPNRPRYNLPRSRMDLGLRDDFLLCMHSIPGSSQVVAHCVFPSLYRRRRVPYSLVA